MTPADVQVETQPRLQARIRTVLRRYRWFLIIVGLPVMVAAIYLFGFAADQYESEAHYMVRSQGSGGGSSSGGLGALLGMGAAAGGGDATSVSDYLLSHDVVDTLRHRLNLIERFRRPEADYLSKLTDPNPSPEALLRYYRKQVDLHFDTESGITALKVRAFRPEDAYAIAQALLTLGEERVNRMNTRSYSDAVSLSRRQRDDAERALNALQIRMTNFRQSGRDVNPTGSADAQIALVSRLNGDLSAAKSQLAMTVQLIGARNPQVDALRQQVRSLSAQVNEQNGRLAGGGHTIAAGLGGYEALGLQQGFLAKRYDAANTAYDAARQQAMRQQLYIVRVVDANMPVKSQYPKRMVTLLTLLATLLLVYGIGWLIVAGVREHAV